MLLRATCPYQIASWFGFANGFVNCQNFSTHLKSIKEYKNLNNKI